MTGITYDLIQEEAEKYAAQYRANHNVPALPTANYLELYKDRLVHKYSKLVDSVKAYVALHDPEGGHGFEHLEWVSSFAGWVANSECNTLNIENEQKDQIIELAMVAGLLHDIDRHLGFDDDHMIEGSKTAARLLTECGIKMPLVVEIVRNHDVIDYCPSEPIELKIASGSVFDPDHLRYGLEREDTFWRMKEKRGKAPAETIHDYAFLPQYRDAWKTNYGKTVGPKIIDFGLAIAKHIEDHFTNS